MGKIKFNYRFTIKPNGKVFTRVRWESGKKETSFCLAVSAEQSKWDCDAQRAIRNTTHNIKGKVFPARIINKEIDQTIDIIANYFAECEITDKISTTEDLKEYVSNKKEQQAKSMRAMPQETEGKSQSELPDIDELFEHFLIEHGKECNWSKTVHQKYRQVWNLLKACKKCIRLDNVDKKTFLDFKIWLIEQGYKNSSITKYFRYLKCIFRWFKEQGAPVEENIFGFKTNLADPIKNVIYITREELEYFEKFKFPPQKQYLSRARDYFCFMCYTSLRYSDLKALKKAAITDGCINVYAQKTKGRLRIPLLSYAVNIFEQYKNTSSGEELFDVPSNQKLNQFIKEAAFLAGLDREVVKTTFCGSEKLEEVHELHEVISCHCARRTFVCVSLSLGIPQSVVMSITGHADYESMRPYISISDETSRRELTKWELDSKRSRLYKVVEELNEEQLDELLEYAEQLLR